MEKQILQMISKEQKQFHCSIFLHKIKENMRKLRDLGLEDAEILAAINEDELLPQLLVTEDYKIMLDDKTSREVKMEPLVKAVYLLFLMHPEGIVFKNLPDYKSELAKIYSEVSPSGLSQRAQRSIEDVTNPLLNSINEKCARIRKAFTTMLDGKVAERYYIKGRRGEAKKISLPRDLVVWESE